MKKFILFAMILTMTLGYAKDSKLRKKWQNAKKEALEQYKKLQDDSSNEEKSKLNITEDFGQLFTFSSNLGPALDNLKKIQAKELKDYDDDDNEDFVLPKKLTWRRLIKRDKKDPIYSAFRTHCSEERAIENLNYLIAIQKVDMKKLDNDKEYKKELKDIKKIWKLYVKKKDINISSDARIAWQQWKKNKYPRVIDKESNYSIKNLILNTNSFVVENMATAWMNFKTHMRKEIKTQEKKKKKEFAEAKSKVLYILNKYQENISTVALENQWEEKGVDPQFWDTMYDLLETIEEDLSDQKYDTEGKKSLQ